jgi:NTE family protein
VKENPQTISLVLGSGGARGLTHIGIIEVLTEHGFEIKSIAGSSMGALIGGIYATGKLDIYRDWVLEIEKLDVIRMLDFSFGRTGLLKGERIINTLKELIGEADIESLPISFTAVATDIESEKEIWLNSGSLFDAIRASISIPTIYTPFDYHGIRLVDGGLINPVPIAPTLNDMTDMTVAVNLSARADSKYDKKRKPSVTPPHNNRYRQAISEFLDGIQKKFDSGDQRRLDMFNIITQSIDVMQNSVARMKLAASAPDLVIDVPRNVSTFYEFYRAAELIEIGRHQAKRALMHAELIKSKVP